VTTDIPYSAAILAGGKSSRFGQDKGLVLFKGKPLIEHVLKQLKSFSDEIFIISNQPGYEYLGLPVYPDVTPNSGPLGGLQTALINSSNQHCLTVACDMPFLNEPLLRKLLAFSNYEAVVPVCDGYAEPLCALYQQTALSIITQQLELGAYKMIDAIERMNHYWMEVDENDDFYHPQLFANINTREQWENMQ
jgi:molybdopterin-guanine dinucleotide biosynthesis protein A